MLIANRDDESVDRTRSAFADTACIPDPEIQEQILAAYLVSLQYASLRVLMLDYDGTLAPFRTERKQARPYPGVREAVGRLARDERNRIVIVTGRTIADFQAVSGFPAGLEIWGSHGWEHQSANGEYEVHPGSERGMARLIRAHTWLKENGFADRVELKTGSLDFNWRGLPDAQVEPLRLMLLKRLPELVSCSGAAIKEFDGGLSLCLPGCDKGVAVRAVLNGLPAGIPVAFLGDDTTDEDAFDALPEPNLGILVRTELRATSAQVWLRPPLELLQFLERWGSAGTNSNSAH